MPAAEDAKEKVLQGLLMHFGHLINEEDTEAMTHVQEGLNSLHARPGRYAPELEDTLHHAHSLVRRYLQPLIGEPAPPESGVAAATSNGHGGNGNGATDGAPQ
jgi:phenylpropionate dioxygenase-like ring-hydroxylating dioxygenase large terminal subunit